MNSSSRISGFSHETNFDAIVIGSGYGGAVSAYRLGEAGLRVAVLEAGYEHKAPNMPRGEAAEWNPAKGKFGPHKVTKLNSKVKGWTGVAVGGGSIVNAAVMIRKDNFENWPGGITRQSLDPYYDRAETMLEARTYPLKFSGSPYANTVKTHAMLEAAKRLNVPSVMPPVAITYRAPNEPVGTLKPNAYGALQQGCRQCGECSLPGCNYQAKNSLDYNYLYGARTRFGVKIMEGSKVDKIEHKPDGSYLLTVIDSKTGLERTFTARVVVVAAGSLGSSELLLRQKRVHGTLPNLSLRLGHQYTTNGTFIGFAIRSKEDLDPSGGPEITAGLDFKGPDGLNQGHLIFDGSFRGFSYETFYVTGRLTGLPDWAIRLVSSGFKLAEKIKLVEPRTTLPLLVIGRDNAVGKFSLDESGQLTTDLNPQDNASFYKRANQHLKAFTKAMGTKFLRFPHWSLQSKIDVPHNLGGVPMGSSHETGVVDDMGRVFGYDNMLVLDGSIIPKTMGANPALTIAALAERSMETVIPQLKERGTITARGEAPQAIPPTRDVSEEFNNLHMLVRHSAAPLPLPDRLRNKRVLWVPGLHARHVGNHSVAILERIRKMGLEVYAVPVDTDTQTEPNLIMIKEAIAQLAPGQGILAGHSRGGNMILDAYRQLSTQDKAKVAHIILVQAPINGSPVADFMLASGLRRRGVAIGTRLIHGTNCIDTIRELSTSGRAAYQQGLPPLTIEDRAKILTVRTIISKGQSTSFEIPRMISQKRGHRTDGLTPYMLSEVHGCADITIVNFDHEQFVVQDPMFFKRLTRYKPHAFYHAGDVTETLLRLCVKMAPQTKSQPATNK